MKNLSNLEKKINSELTTKIKSTKINHEHICINIENENLLEVVLFLKNNNETKFKQLIDITGKLSISPYCDRVFVIVDGVHSPTLTNDLNKMGLPDSNFLKLNKNGIEFYYPDSILQAIYKDETLKASNLTIIKDEVSHNGIAFKKSELNQLVLDKITGQESLNGEIVSIIENVSKFN